MGFLTVARSKGQKEAGFIGGSQEVWGGISPPSKLPINTVTRGGGDEQNSRGQICNLTVGTDYYQIPGDARSKGPGRWSCW